MRLLIGFLCVLVAVVYFQSERHGCGQMPLASNYWISCITR
jgi:hypothetical protein